MSETTGTVREHAVIVPQAFEVSFQWRPNRNPEGKSKQLFLGRYQGVAVIMHHTCPRDWLPEENTPIMVRLLRRSENGTSFVLPRDFAGPDQSNDLSTLVRSGPPRPSRSQPEPAVQSNAETLSAPTCGAAPAPVAASPQFVSDEPAKGKTIIVRFDVKGQRTRASDNGQPLAPHKQLWGARMPANRERWEVEIIDGPPAKWKWVRAIRGPISGKK